MPATAQTWASRLGMPYRPDLMQGTSNEARQYQDTITNAALQDAWKFGNGDPAQAARYYFGGSDQSNWGPKTRAYSDEILARINRMQQSGYDNGNGE